ncbi:hypothetical protein EJB05_21096, partial [Eragrostis curvula]
MGNLFSSTPPSRPLAAGLGPALGLVELCHGAVSGAPRERRLLVGRVASRMAYLHHAAAPGAVPSPAAAVVPLPAVSRASGGAPFLALFLKLPVGSPSALGIFLGIPPASSGSPFLAFGVNLAAEATGGAAASAALGPIPAELNMSAGVPAASTSASAFARLDRDSAAIKGSRLPAAPLTPRQAESYGHATGEVGVGSFLGSGAPSETRGLGAAVSSLPRDPLSDSRPPAVADAPGNAFSQQLILPPSRAISWKIAGIDSPLPASVDFLIDKHLWNIIDSRDGLLLMEPKFGGNHFLVCNPLLKTRIDVPAPDNIPPMYTLLVAGLVPEGRASWRIITLFGCYVKSLSRTQERCWLGSFSCTNKSWEGQHQQLHCDLPDCRMGIKPPSILTGGYWNVLIFNKNILSVHLDTLTLARRKLPFDRITFNLSSSFAEKNCLLLLDGLISIDIESGSVSLPFMVDFDARLADLVPYEMAWPPKPRLQKVVQVENLIDLESDCFNQVLRAIRC